MISVRETALFILNKNRYLINRIRKGDEMVRLWLMHQT